MAEEVAMPKGQVTEAQIRYLQQQLGIAQARGMSEATQQIQQAMYEAGIAPVTAPAPAPAPAVTEEVPYTVTPGQEAAEARLRLMQKDLEVGRVYAGSEAVEPLRQAIEVEKIRASESSREQFKADPYATEFNVMSIDVKEQFAKDVGADYSPRKDLDINYVQVGTALPKQEYVPKQYVEATLKDWAKENDVRYEELRDTLERGGVSALNSLINVAVEQGLLKVQKEQARYADIIEQQREYAIALSDIESYLDKDASEITMVDLESLAKAGKDDSIRQIYGESVLSEVNESLRLQEKYQGWTTYELLHGRMVNDVYEIPPVDDVGGMAGRVWHPRPDWVTRRLIEAQIEAQKDLEPYRVTRESPIYSPELLKILEDRVPHIKKQLEEGKGWFDILPKTLLEEVKAIDLSQAIRNNVPTETIKMAGFTDADIANAKISIKQQDEIAELEAKYKDLENRLSSYASQQVVPFTIDTATMTPQEILEIGDKQGLAQTQTVYDIGKALADKSITKDELKEVGYSQEAIDKAEVMHDMGWKVWIPVYGTIGTWGVSKGWEKGINIVSDALFLIPWYGWLSKAGTIALQAETRALAVGIAPRVGLLSRAGAIGKTALKVGEETLLAPVKFPLQLIKSPKVALKGLAEVTVYPFAHPIESLKGIRAVATGRALGVLGEPLSTRAVKFITQWAAIPQAAVAIPTHGTGVQRVFADSLIARGVPPKQADDLALEATRVMQLKLSDMIVRGEPIPKTMEVPIYEGGQKVFTIEFDQTTLMRELGQAIHTTPFAERIMAGAAEPTPQKVYFSTAMSPEWTGVTARGYTTPEAIELGRGGAVMKNMRINRMFDPVSKTYRNTVELEMTTAKGTQLVTGREPILNVLKAEGNVNIYPSVLMEQTNSRNIVEALRASTGKQFKFKPVNFDEVNSIPKGSASEIEGYVRTNDMMVGGSTAERTWTDTIKLPEDIDLISMRNNAKVDSENIAKLIENTTGLKTRVKTPAEVGKEVYRIEVNRNGKWEQVTDVLDYRIHRTYNPDIMNREPVTIEGIKVEHPLEQAERIVAKYGEYQRGEVPLEKHRGHAKRLAWMAEKILDTPGGNLGDRQTAIMEIVGSRIDYPVIARSQLIRMKLGGLRDTLIDRVAEVIPTVKRGVRVKTPDGRTVKVPKTTAEKIESYLKNNPKATQKEIDEIIARGLEDIANENVARRVADGTYRAEAEKIIDADPQLRELPSSERIRIIDDMIARETYRLHEIGRFTVDDVKGMLYAGTLSSSVGRALYELASEIGDSIFFKELSEYKPTAEEAIYEPMREAFGTYIEPREAIVEIPPAEIPTERITEEVFIAEIPSERMAVEEYRPPAVIEEVSTERIAEGVPIEEIPPEIPREEIPREEISIERLIEEMPREIPREEFITEDERRLRDEKLKEEERLREERLREDELKKLHIEVSQIPTEWEKTGVPRGTIEYRSGIKWIVIPPPYRDEDKMYLDHPLPGTRKFSVGKGSAYRTLQVIGGLPKEDVDIDVGWADVHISSKTGKLEMTYTGGKEAADDRWAMEREVMSELERESYEGIPAGLVETSRIPRTRIRQPLEDVREVYPPEISGEGEPLSEQDLLLQQIERGLARRETSRVSVPRIGSRYYNEEDMVYVPAHYRRKSSASPIVEDSGIQLQTRTYLGRKLRPTSVGTGV